MWCVGEHIHRLYCNNLVVAIQFLQVTSLSRRITTDIDDTLWCSLEDSLHHVRMHTCTGWVSDDDVRPTMFGM